MNLWTGIGMLIVAFLLIWVRRVDNGTRFKLRQQWSPEQSPHAGQRRLGAPRSKVLKLGGQVSAAVF
jgi:hypothetical protein